MTFPGDETLDADDPFERAVIEIVLLNRKKRSDYAQDGDPFSNFRQVAETVGIDVHEVVDTFIATKTVRLMNLKLNGRGPVNESVLDSRLDRAVYSIIDYAIALEEQQ